MSEKIEDLKELLLRQVHPRFIEEYYPSHRLSVNGTGFHGVEHLDDLIDQAMELYP